MILTDFSKIKFGNADIKAVYAGSVKIWPVTSGDTGDRRTMRFTTTDGNTWNKDNISAYTADNRLIEPTEKTSTGWTYAEDVEYLVSLGDDFNAKTFNLLTFNGFGAKIKIKNANRLFYLENNATDIDTKYLDVSEAADFTYMFGGCNSLASVDVSNFDTSKAVSMWGMFGGCNKLASLNLSKWNTSNVVKMRDLFKDCKALTSLDLSNWDTSKVQLMTGMFKGCRALTSLDVSHFNTSNVTSMGNMFFNCSSLTSLDLSNWDTSKVTDMSGMFYTCTKLTTLDFSNWDLTNLTETGGMFSGRFMTLKTITMKNCSSASVEKIKEALEQSGRTNVEIIQ